MSSELIIEKQVKAYNSRDIDTFSACHAEDVQLFRFDEPIPFATGRDQVYRIYKDIFERSPNLHSAVSNRMVMGDTVIDQETITGRNENEQMEVIAIYKVKNKLISKAYFIWKSPQ